MILVYNRLYGYLFPTGKYFYWVQKLKINFFVDKIGIPSFPPPH